MDKILRLNVSDSTIKIDHLPTEYSTLGGRGLIAKMLLNEVKPSCDPLGQHNKLIITCGLLAGTTISSSGRLSIGAKSPLTGGIKESNAGGLTASRMAKIGLRTIVVEGLPQDKQKKILIVKSDEASLIPAGEFEEMGVYETAEKLLSQYPKSSVTCIGPAGEKMYSCAGIATIDKDGIPSRYSGRGGLGAVMGAKGLKAIVVVGSGKIAAFNPDEFMKTSRLLNKEIKDSPMSKTYREYGTPAMVETINALNGFPVKNFSQGKSDKAEKISGEAMRATILERGGSGRATHMCMPGCLVACSNVYADKEGKTIVSPIEYENIGLLGSNLDIWDLDQIAKLNYLCNDIGVDTIESGAAIGVMMEAGLLEFGDFIGAMNLLEEMRIGTVIGRLLGSGAATTGKVLGVRNIPSIKGQAMAAYDPRAVKGMGVTYATSAMGADHTAGPAARAQVDHHDAAGKAKLSRKIQKLIGVFDITGLCLFTVGGVATNKKLVVDLLNARFGWKYNLDWLDNLCVQMLKDEKQFNEFAGITAAHHKMPEAFTERKMPGIDTVFDVTDEDLKTVFDYDQEED